MKIGMSLQDLQASPTARNRRERRKQKAVERAKTLHRNVAERRSAFLALMGRGLGALSRGEEPGDELTLVLARAWDPKRDEPFREATMLLYKLAVRACTRA